MNRKFLANVLAASLVLTMAPVVPKIDADAAQKLSVESQSGGISNLPGLRTAYVATSPAIGEGTDFSDDLTCGPFWTAWTQGIEVTEKGVTLTFNNITTGDKNYNSPGYVIYKGDENKVNGVGYHEYGYIRSDVYGWSTNNTLWTQLWVNEERPNEGGTYTISNVPENDDEWKAWLDANKNQEGANYMVSAVIKKSALVLYVNANGVEHCTAFKVDTNEPVYLSLSGDNCKLSNINKANQYYDFTSKIPEEVNTFIENSEGMVPPVVDENAPHLYSGEGTANNWWANPKFSNDQTLKDGSSVDWYVGYYENIKNVTSAFIVEIKATDSEKGYNYFITTESDVDAWAVIDNIGGGRVGDVAGTITGKAKGSKNIELGHRYKITTKREGQNFTVTYTDLSTNSEYAKFVFADTDLPAGDVNVHIIALTGKYRIEEKEFTEMPAVVDNNPPLATYPLPVATQAPLPSVAPEPTPVLDAETLTGTAWWTGNQKGRDYTLKGEGTLDLYVAFDSNSTNEPGAFSVELLSDSNKYITTGSDINIWTAEGAEGTVSGGTLGGTITVGHVYKVSITRTGYDFTIVYFDVTDNKEHCTLKATGTNQGVEVNVHIMAQVGTFRVSQTALDGTEQVASATPDASATPEPSTTPDPVGTPAPGDSDNSTPGGNNPSGGTTGDDTPQTPTDTDEPKDDEKETKKTMKVSGINAKKNTKKVTGTVSVKNAKVKVKVGSKAYKNAKVSGKKFTFTASSKLKKGTTIKIKVTKSGYKTVTKTVKVK